MDQTPPPTPDDKKNSGTNTPSPTSPLPTQLQNPTFRFVLVKPREKSPYEKAWPTTNNYPHNSPKLISHIKNGGNYGVIGEHGTLLIIDFDNIQLQTAKIGLLPPTFSVKTGTGKLHLYYTTDNTRSWKIMDAEKRTLADIQGHNKLVIGPGSTHPNGNKYEIERDLPINHITHETLISTFSDYLDHTTKLNDTAHTVRTRQPTNNDDIINTIKTRWRISDELRNAGIDTNRNPTQCPMHDSVRGQCLSYDDNKGVWYCFHESTGGDCITLRQQRKKLTFPAAIKELATELNIIPQQTIIRATSPGNEQRSNNDGSSSRNPQPTQPTQVQPPTPTDELTRIRQEFIAHKINKDLSAATEAVVTYILERHHILAPRDESKESTWIYRDGIYVPDGKTYLYQIIQTITLSHYTKTLAISIIDKVLTRRYVEKETFFSTTTNPDEICLQNGILNIHTKQLRPHNPNTIFFSKVPINYTQHTTCPNTTKFMTDTLQELDIPIIQELTGYLLYRRYTIPNFFIFAGKGRNGKTILTQLFEHFLGKQNVSSISPHQMSQDQYALSLLHGKLACLCSDISSGVIKNTNTIKMLCGGDNITSHQKYQLHFTFINHAKLVFSANELPNFNDASRGFFERGIIIDFIHTFLTQDQIDKLPEQEKEKVKLADRNILDKITTPQELSGLLNWALEGLNRLLKNGRFSRTSAYEDNQVAFDIKSNPVKYFLDNFTEPAGGYYINKDSFHNALVKFCERVNVTPPNETRIGLLMDNHGIDTYRVQEKGKRRRYWNNLKWLSVETDMDHGESIMPDLIIYDEIDRIVRGIWTPTKKAKKRTDEIDNAVYADLTNSKTNILERKRALLKFLEENKLGSGPDLMSAAIGCTVKEACDLLRELSLTGIVFESKPDLWHILN